MHLRVIDWRGGVFYGAYRDCFGVRVYAVYLFICCAERLPARDTFKNARRSTRLSADLCKNTRLRRLGLFKHERMFYNRSVEI